MGIVVGTGYGFIHYDDYDSDFVTISDREDNKIRIPVRVVESWAQGIAQIHRRELETEAKYGQDSYNKKFPELSCKTCGHSKHKHVPSGGSILRPDRCYPIGSCSCQAYVNDQ